MNDGKAALAALEERMAALNVFGQWQIGANRPQNVRRGPNNVMMIEPVPSGVSHIWPWESMYPLFAESRAAMPESFTARRSLILTNPGLERGTTQTLLVGLQTIAPGEIAWAHRHTVTALRFVIEGGKDVYTVVDGEPLPMEPYDLILTPGWCWHDHHNESDKPAIWLDTLDVPFMLAINQNFYEELDESVQDRRPTPTPGSPLLRSVGDGGEATPAYRYPWTEVRPRLENLAARSDADDCDGVLLEYVNVTTGGATLKTISCRVQWLPPGFKGTRHRHSASAAYFVIEGAGRMVVEDNDMPWTLHDSFVVPNWSWHRIENRSKTEPAILFTVTDTPLLEAFDLYRQETEE